MIAVPLCFALITPHIQRLYHYIFFRFQLMGGGAIYCSAGQLRALFECSREALPGVCTNHCGILSSRSGSLSGSNGGQSGGCRQFGCGRSCQRAGGCRGSLSSLWRRPHRHHRGQLPRPQRPRPRPGATGGRSLVQEQDGLLSQSQQGLGLRPWSRAHCGPAGLAAAQDPFEAAAPRSPPGHRGDTTSGNSTMHYP